MTLCYGSFFKTTDARYAARLSLRLTRHQQNIEINSYRDGFSRPGLSNSDEVSAAEGDGPALALDGGRLLPALLSHCLHYVLCTKQIHFTTIKCN